MPCRSDYLEPSSREHELQRAAKLLVYLKRKLGHAPQAWMMREAGNQYASDERCVTKLCATLRAMSDPDRDRIVYNARDAVARDLADWWEEHQRADRKRERKEKQEREEEALRNQAIAKLSPAERRALGLK